MQIGHTRIAPLPITGRKSKRDVESLKEEIPEMETVLLRLLSFKEMGSVFILLSLE